MGEEVGTMHAILEIKRGANKKIDWKEKEKWERKRKKKK
jgi:hypothetical protein